MDLILPAALVALGKEVIFVNSPCLHVGYWRQKADEMRGNLLPM